jgi:hypothetical protein
LEEVAGWNGFPGAFGGVVPVVLFFWLDFDRGGPDGFVVQLDVGQVG